MNELPDYSWTYAA